MCFYLCEVTGTGSVVRLLWQHNTELQKLKGVVITFALKLLLETHPVGFWGYPRSSPENLALFMEIHWLVEKVFLQLASSALLVFVRRAGYSSVNFRPKEVCGKQVAHNSEPGRIGSKYVEIFENLQLWGSSQNLAHAQFLCLQGHLYFCRVWGSFASVCPRRKAYWCDFSYWEPSCL